MPRVIKVGCSMGLQGCKIEDEIHVDDDASPEQIEEESSAIGEQFRSGRLLRAPHREGFTQRRSRQVFGMDLPEMFRTVASPEDQRDTPALVS